jgi:hypothetical protein
MGEGAATVSMHAAILGVGHYQKRILQRPHTRSDDGHLAAGVVGIAATPKRSGLAQMQG